MAEVVHDGQRWRTGTAADVEWIKSGTEVGLTITSAIPPMFDAYATIMLPHNVEQDQAQHDRAMIAVLTGRNPDQPWWLRYLTRSRNSVVPGAPQVCQHADWPYVFMQVGPDQAAL